MKLPRVRLTIRRLMIAVAIVAMLAGIAIEISRRRARFHELAVHYRRMERNTFHRGYYISATLEEFEEYSRRWPRLKPYYTEMTGKYELAERRPWMPVAPDPPEPE